MSDFLKLDLLGAAAWRAQRSGGPGGEDDSDDDEVAYAENGDGDARQRHGRHASRSRGTKPLYVQHSESPSGRCC